MLEKYDIKDLYLAYINVKDNSEVYVVFDDVICWYTTVLKKEGEKYIDLQYPERYIGETKDSINYVIDYIEPLSEYYPTKTNKKFSKRKAINQASKNFEEFYQNRNIKIHEEQKKLRLNKIKS